MDVENTDLERRVLAHEQILQEGLCTSVRPVYMLCTKQEHQGKVIIR
jgi:hypothetical protein